MHDKTTRENNKEMNVQEILQRLGIVHAVEKFLSDFRTSNKIREVYFNGCQEIADLIKTMPVSIQKTLNERLADFKADDEDFVDCCREFIKGALASRMSPVCEILDETSQQRIAEIYKDAFEEFGDPLMELVGKLAEELFETSKKGFTFSWIAYIDDVENADEREVILSVAI